MRAAARLALLCMLPAAAARAQQPAPTLVVRLDYDAPAACPDAKDFRAQVRGRTARVEFAEPGAPSDLSWSVVVRETKSGSSGALRVSGGELGKLERTVTASSCDQVVGALALGAALSVDPEASLTPRPRPEPARQEPAPAQPPEPTAPPSAARATRLSLGLSLTARSGMAPRLSWAPRPFVGISFRSSGHTWGLRLSATQAHGSATSDVGQADFTWSLGRLEAFPIRWGSSWLRFEPALFVEAGLLRARGVAVTPVAEVRPPVLFLGALGRISLVAFDLLLLDLEAGPAVPLIRDRFYIHENTTVFRAPALGGFAAAGVGLEFL